MSQHHAHHERHFTASELVRDVVLGMSDGLTVPFALAAGLSGALGETRVVVIAGLAEIAAGSIAMGLGGYLAAKSEADHYDSERRREQMEVREKPQAEAKEVEEALHAYGIEPDESMVIVQALKRNPEHWVDFMMRFELGLEKPDRRRAINSAVTIALSYLLSGLIPLSPYMAGREVQTALLQSVALTLLALLLFGYLKGVLMGIPPVKSALQTTVISGLAGGAAYWIARAFSG